jgi:hypothetical protein
MNRDEGSLAPNAGFSGTTAVQQDNEGSPRFLDFEIAADLAAEVIVDFAMTWDC